jgi:hypothetical protein
VRRYEVSVYVPCPKGTRGKDISCTITTKGVELRLASSAAASSAASSAAASSTQLVGDFPYAIRTDESLWNLDSETSTVVLTLDKVQKTWWESVVKGDPKIDCSKVDSTMKIDECVPPPARSPASPRTNRNVAAAGTTPRRRGRSGRSCTSR